MTQELAEELLKVGDAKLGGSRKDVFIDIDPSDRAAALHLD